MDGYVLLTSMVLAAIWIGSGFWVCPGARAQTRARAAPVPTPAPIPASSTPIPAPISAKSTAPSVRLTAAFSPERLGAATTIRTSLRVIPPAGRPPLPVTEFELRYPNELGFGTSELGLETCLPAQLEAHGSAGCPGNSLMGHGSALVEVPFGPRKVLEKAPVTIYSRPVREGKLGLLFLASGKLPVIANLVFGAFVRHAREPFGGLIDTSLPLVPSVPRGPYVALVGLQSTIGPDGITYRERVNGRTVAFHPRGMLLPPHCPRGGFPFAARLTFADGSNASATTAVPCPRGGGGSRRGQ
jgi:hypothetical protein